MSLFQTKIIITAQYTINVIDNKLNKINTFGPF